MSSTKSHIPVIDFDRANVNRQDDDLVAEDLEDIGKQIKTAFQSVGFCYLKNYGINHEIIERIFTTSHHFFLLPDKKKSKNAKLTGGNFGWVCVEREQFNTDRPGDLKEAFNYSPVADPNKWSSKEFKEANKNMFDYCHRLSKRVCDVMSIGLGLGNALLRDAHRFIGKEGNPSILRTLYYPPILEESRIKPGQIRLGEHSDYGTIALLFQDEIGGLEVEVPGVGYVPATPIPDTVLVNIGDMMQRWTSDSLIATKHRVLIPEVEMKKRSHRQSVVFYVQPDDNCIIKCLDGSNKYAPITSIEYLDQRLSATYKK